LVSEGKMEPQTVATTEYSLVPDWGTWMES
jgi:hypothetical protein